MYPEELKDRAIELYMEGNSGRAVGRLLKISKNMCLRWIRQKAKKIKPKDRSNERVEVMEREKTPIYIMTLVYRKTREILGYDIARDRSLQRKSRCFFRSFDTIFAVFKIFIFTVYKFSHIFLFSP